MEDLEKVAIDRLRTAAMMSEKLYKQPLLIAYSGGKDSDTMLHLAEKSGVRFDVLHNLTTADAPQTVYHVKKTFQRLENKGIHCEIDAHENPDGTRTTLWNLIPKKLIPPTRLMRYCCSELKETGGKGRFISTGVRWDESSKRKANRGALEIIHRDRKKSLILSNDNDEDRMLFESCQLKGKRVCNPVIDWKDSDIWDYCRNEKIEMNPLYSDFNRVGCIGCPMAGGKTQAYEFQIFPKYKNMYLMAFARMLEKRKEKGCFDETMRWGATAEDVMHWWLNDGVLPGQMRFEGME